MATNTRHRAPADLDAGSGQGRSRQQRAVGNVKGDSKLFINLTASSTNLRRKRKVLEVSLASSPVSPGPSSAIQLATTTWDDVCAKRLCATCEPSWTKTIDRDASWFTSSSGYIDGELASATCSTDSQQSAACRVHISDLFLCSSPSLSCGESSSYAHFASLSASPTPLSSTGINLPAQGDLCSADTSLAAGRPLITSCALAPLGGPDACLPLGGPALPDLPPVPRTSLIGTLAAMYGFTPLATALGASYFRRATARCPALLAAAAGEPDYAAFVAPPPPPDPQPLDQPLGAPLHQSQTHKHWLTAVHLTCVMLAAKNVEFVPYKRLLPTMLTHIYAAPIAPAASLALELQVLDALRWRLGPFTHEELH